MPATGRVFNAQRHTGRSLAFGTLLLFPSDTALYPFVHTHNATPLLITVGLMVHRMETISSMDEERKVQGGEGRFAPPPAVEQPGSERRKGSIARPGGD